MDSYKLYPYKFYNKFYKNLHSNLYKRLSIKRSLALKGILVMNSYK